MNSCAAVSALALTLLSASCDDGQYTIPATAERVPLQLSVSQMDDTRLNGTQWEAGDQIGVYLIDANGNYVDGATNIRYVIDPVSNACTVANADSIIILEKGATYTALKLDNRSGRAGIPCPIGTCRWKIRHRSMCCMQR